MTLAFVVVCEAEADFRTAAGLADRVIREGADWITEEGMNDYRRWRGLDDRQPYILWRQVGELARQARIRVHGHFDGQPGELDAQMARKALRLLESWKGGLDGVLLIRDDDRRTERRKGLEQARATRTIACPVVIGLAHLKRECWALVGFEPRGPEEQSTLSALMAELGFDPRTESQRLTGRDDGELRSAKRVLRLLTGSPEREADCWLLAPLALLRARGQEVGLTAYLDEVKAFLVPLFTGRTAG